MRRKILMTLLLSVCIALTGAALFACTTFESSTDKVASVVLNDYPSQSVTVYQNETPGFDDCTLLVTYESGRTAVVPFDDPGVEFSGLATQNAGEQTYTVSYGGKSTVAFVTVMPLVIENIEIRERPETIIVVEGNAFEPSGISLAVNYTNGSSVVIARVGAEMVSGYSTSLKPGEHTVYISYHGASLPLTITVVPKSLNSVEVDTSPAKTAYYQGEEFIPSGLKLKLNYNNGSSEVVSYDENPSAFTFSLDHYMDPETLKFFSSSNGSRVAMTVKYLGANGEYADSGAQASFEVEIRSVAPESIVLEKLPKTIGFKTPENEGDPYYESYRGVSELTDVVRGDGVDWSTGAFRAIYNDGSVVENIPMSGNDVYLYVNGTADSNRITYKDNYRFDTVGSMTIYITYGSTGSFIQITVNVTAPDPIALEIDYLGAKPLEEETFFDGDRLSTDNLVYNVFYNNATEKFEEGEEGAVTDRMLAAGETFTLVYNELNDEDGDGVSAEKITLTYSDEATGERAVTYDIRLNVTALEALDYFYSLPYKSSYLKNSASLDFTGSSLKVEMNSGAVEYFPVWDETVTENSVYCDADGNEKTASEVFSAAGSYILKINYAGAEVVFEFEVVEEDVGTLALYRNGAPVASGQIYEFAFYEDFIAAEAGFELRITANGATATVQWADSDLDVKGKDGSGERTMAFIYKEYAYALVGVNFYGSRLASLEIQTAPEKTVYAPGEDFDPQGLILKAVHDNGNIGTVSSTDASILYGELPKSVERPTLYSLPITYLGTMTYLDIVLVPEGVTATGIKLSDEGRAEDAEYDFLVTKSESLMFYYVSESGTVEEPRFVVSFSDGSTVAIPLRQAFVPYSADYINPGENPVVSVNVRFNKLTTPLTLYFSDRVLTSIEVFEYPSRLNYVEGQALSVEGGFIRRFYDNGESDIIPMTNGFVTVRGYNSSPFTSGTYGNSMSQTVELVYRGARTTFTVTTYKKLNPLVASSPGDDGVDYGVTVANISLEYGNFDLSPAPRINIPIADFNDFVPDMTIEYLLDDVWTDSVPVYPGKYEMRVIVEGNECFNGAELSIPYSFERYNRLLTVTVIDTTKVYGSSDPSAYDFVIDEGDLLEGDSVEFNFVRTPGEDVGSYDVTVEFASGEGNQNGYYLLIPVKGSLNITKRVVNNSSGQQTVTVTFRPLSTTHYHDGVFTYTGEPIAGFEITYIDETGATVIVNARDVVYYDGDGNRLESPPTERDDYEVRISDNYSINGSYRFSFSIA